MAARDEGDRIGATIASLALAFPGAAIWVADDGSQDLTGEIARLAGARVHGAGRARGKGEAVTGAARRALQEARAKNGGERGRPVFVLCDGDLGESARELTALVDVLRAGDAELAVAAFSRRLGGGFGLAVGFARWAIRERCGFESSAPISGQRALTARALEDVLPLAHGFGMELGMTIDAVRSGHRIVELELDLDHRASGRDLAGFVHRGRQLADCVRAYLRRR